MNNLAYQPAEPTEATVINIYMTLDQYADHLLVHVRTVNRLVKQGLPSIKFGKTRRIPWREADAWLASPGACTAEKPRRYAKRPQKAP